MKNVLVLFGGKSVEHDVSVITGVMTANCLNIEKYNVFPVLVTENGDWVTGSQLLDIDEYKTLDYKKLTKVTLKNGCNVLYKIKGKRLKEIAPIYVAINCMHGGDGENGSIAGLLATCNIPLASPNVLSSAISMDKQFTKIFLKGLGIKSLEGKSVKSMAMAEHIKDQLSYPVIVKPNLLGSSIGISKVEDKERLTSAVAFSLKYGESAIIEPCLENFIEINCAVYRNQKGELIVSECEQPIGASEVLSFGDKYENGKRIFPANISKKLSNKIKRTTKLVYDKCAFSGIIRIDYFIKDGQIYLNEINSIPGSLAYYLFCNTLSEFSKLLDQLIGVAVSEYCKKSTYLTLYRSKILNTGGIKGAKKNFKEKS